MGFWNALRDWAPLAQLFVLAALGVMGLWLRSEFYKFRRDHLEPLAAKLGDESKTREVELLKVEGLVSHLDRAVSGLQTTASKLDGGAITAAIALGKHEEQIITLFRRFERIEDRIVTIEHNTERRGRPRPG